MKKTVTFGDGHLDDLKVFRGQTVMGGNRQCGGIKEYSFFVDKSWERRHTEGRK